MKGAKNMIKIIRAPKPAKIAQYRVTCKRCGTIFECDSTDFHNIIVGHRDSDTVVNCPICGSHCSHRLAPYFCTIESIEGE